MVRESTASWIQKSLTKKKRWKNYHECIETSFTKITYEKVKNNKWTQKPALLKFSWMSFRGFYKRKKTRTGRNLQKSVKNYHNSTQKQAPVKFPRLGLSGFYERKKLYGQKFTQKALRKCSFYNSALCRRIVMNLHCEKGVKI